MKKLQLFTLLMLLSTGYIAQASEDNRPQRGQGGQRSGQGGQQGEHRKGGHGQGSISKDKVTAELGGSVTFESAQRYAESYAQEVGNLSESSTADEFKAVMEKGKVLKTALMQLAPKKGGKQKDGQGQLPENGGTSRSGGPMKGKKQPPARNNQ
jgi:hypothetical protein